MKKSEALIHILVSDRPAQGEMNITFYIILKKDRRTKLYDVRRFRTKTHRGSVIHSERYVIIRE